MSGFINRVIRTGAAGTEAVWYCSICKKRSSRFHILPVKGLEDLRSRDAVISEFFKREGGT